MLASLESGFAVHQHFPVGQIQISPPAGPKADPHPLGLHFNSFGSMPLLVACFLYYFPCYPTKSRVDFTPPCWLCLILTTQNTEHILSILQTKTLSSYSRNGMKPQQHQCSQGGEKNPKKSKSSPLQACKTPTGRISHTAWNKLKQKTKRENKATLGNPTVNRSLRTPNALQRNS